MEMENFRKNKDFLFTPCFHDMFPLLVNQQTKVTGWLSGTLFLSHFYILGSNSTSINFQDIW